MLLLHPETAALQEFMGKAGEGGGVLDLFERPMLAANQVEPQMTMVHNTSPVS